MFLSFLPVFHVFLSDFRSCTSHTVFRGLYLVAIIVFLEHTLSYLHSRSLGYVRELVLVPVGGEDFSINFVSPAKELSRCWLLFEHGASAQQCWVAWAPFSVLEMIIIITQSDFSLAILRWSGNVLLAVFHEPGVTTGHWRAAGIEVCCNSRSVASVSPSAFLLPQLVLAISAVQWENGIRAGHVLHGCFTGTGLWSGDQKAVAEVAAVALQRTQKSSNHTEKMCDRMVALQGAWTRRCAGRDVFLCHVVNSFLFFYRKLCGISKT